MKVSRPGIAGIAAVAVVLGALVALALQPGGGEDGPLNAIAAAAERTQSEPGGHTTMRAIVTRPGSEPLRLTGHGVFDENERSREIVTFPDPKSDGSVEMEMVTDGAVMYMRSEMFDSLPGDSEWMALDFSFAGDLEAPVPAGGEAASELELLEEATGGVRKLGEETVRGVPTTRYRGTVDEEEVTPLTLEVWIDGDGLVRRMRIVQERRGDGGEGPAKIDMRTDFFDFGVVPEIEIPEEGEVFDATPLAEEAAPG